MQRKNSATFLCIKKIQLLIRYLCTAMLLITLFMSHHASGIEWIVLQTTYQINNSDQTSEKAPHFQYSYFQCLYCGEILFQAVQYKGTNTHSCLACAKKMRQFIQSKHTQSKHIDFFLETQESHSKDYHALFALFPHARFNQQAFMHAIRPLNHYTYFEHIPMQDFIKHWTGTKKQPVHVLCKDCNQLISVFSLFLHATTHYIKCRVCNFSPEPGALCERTQHIISHQLSCYDTCQYCHLDIPLTHKEAHHTSCKEKRVTCSECNQPFTIEEHLLHVTHCTIYQAKKKHHFITCPICSERVMGTEYAMHYMVLHSESKHMCPYCTQFFFHW